MKTIETVILILFALSIAAASISIVGRFFYYEVWCKLPRSCENAAFKEYATKTYQRILDEEQDFIKYLDDEHAAQERATFERFMDSRK